MHQTSAELNRLENLLLALVLGYGHQLSRQHNDSLLRRLNLTRYASICHELILPIFLELVLSEPMRQIAHVNDRARPTGTPPKHRDLFESNLNNMGWGDLLLLVLLF